MEKGKFRFGAFEVSYEEVVGIGARNVSTPRGDVKASSGDFILKDNFGGVMVVSSGFMDMLKEAAGMPEDPLEDLSTELDISRVETFDKQAGEVAETAMKLHEVLNFSSIMKKLAEKKPLSEIETKYAKDNGLL